MIRYRAPVATAPVALDVNGAKQDEMGVDSDKYGDKYTEIDRRRAMKLPPSEVTRKNLEYTHVDLSKDENETVDVILSSDPNCDILITPTHHFDEDGVFCGFRVCYPQHTSGVQLPVHRKMFFGVTMVEASSAVGVNSDVISLVSNKQECNRKMQELMREIDEESRGKEASLQCMPQNVDMQQANGNVIGIREQRAVDCHPWNPEVPEFVGIYHAYTRGYNKDNREHRLYIACGGGCTLASDAFYNLLLDLGPSTDIDEIVDSQETWWLRRACYRSRCRILYRVAERFGLTVPSITDMHSYDSVPMARSTTDTVRNDIMRMRSGHIGVFNNAVDTTTSRNGIINTMHPAEGLWVFKGPVRSSQGLTSLGSGWGDQRTCGVFPVGSYKVVTAAHQHGKRDVRHGLTTVVSRAKDDVICFGDCNPHDTANEYLWYDENFMRTLEKMGYDRNCGLLELMPITVSVSVW